MWCTLPLMTDQPQPVDEKFRIFDQCLDIVYRCIDDEPLALLTEQFLRVRILTELCRDGVTIEETPPRKSRKYSTFVTISNPRTDDERVNFRTDRRSTINITDGCNVDIKIAGVDPFSVDLKCKGDFGSNAILRDRICSDMCRVLGVKGVCDFFILATTVGGFQDLLSYTYVRDGESDAFAAAVPRLSEIRNDRFQTHFGHWAGDEIAVRSRRLKTRYYESERLVLGFWDGAGYAQADRRKAELQRYWPEE